MKHVLILMLLLGSYHCEAQIYKGQYLIGGNGVFDYIKLSDHNVSRIKVSPDIGYFFIDKLAVGTRVNVASATELYRGGGKVRSSEISFAPFIRYYFLKSEKKVNFFSDLDDSFGWGKYNYFGTIPNYTYHFNVFTFSAGPAIFLNEHTSLEVTIGYSYRTRALIDTFPSNTLHLGVGLQIHLGNKGKEDK